MKKWTAAHWGSYLVESNNGQRYLRQDPNDPDPAPSGEAWLEAMRDPQVRIARPAIRRGWLKGDRSARRGDDPYIQVGWDEALEHVERELRRIREKYGNAAIFAGSYGWASAGRFHHAQSQMRRFLNLIGGYVSQHDTYSHAAAGVLFPHILGMDISQMLGAMSTWPNIARSCDVFLAFGGLSGRTAQMSSGGTATHDMKSWFDKGVQRGMELINISPRRNDIDYPSARWLPIKPGSDTALMLALCFELVALGQHDVQFLETRTSGWREFVEYLTGDLDGVPKSPEWAAPICDLTTVEIRSLARHLIGKRVMVAVAWGLQRAQYGEQPVWGGLALACMLGQIGREGGGYGFGYGSSAHIGRPIRKVAWPAFNARRNPLNIFIPVAHLAKMLDNPGVPYHYNGQTYRYPDARLVYWVGGNPFHHHMDLNHLEQAWQKPETIVVHDHSWTATARRADIVLPSTSALERSDLMINNRDKTLLMMDPVMPRYGEARDDHEIFRDLAQRFGVLEAFTENKEPEQWLETMWESSRVVAAAEGIALPSFQAFSQDVKRIDIPEIYEDRVFLSQYCSDPEKHALTTESGRITLFNQEIAAMNMVDCGGCPMHFEPVEELSVPTSRQADKLYPFYLLANQPRFRLHSQLDNGPTADKGKMRGRAICEIHSRVAAALSVEDGDIIVVGNQRGRCLASVKTCDAMRQDCVVLATGAWFDPAMVDGELLEVHGNPNVLTADIGTSELGQGPVGHGALVYLQPWRHPLPEIKVLREPEFVSEESANSAL